MVGFGNGDARLAACPPIADYKWRCCHGDIRRVRDGYSMRRLRVYCNARHRDRRSPVPVGAAAPVSPLTKAITTISATIGGIAAPVSFAGLSPGFAGLYQVNVTVPVGVKSGSSVPVGAHRAGLSSPPMAVAIR
jgi:hypothetical protein